MHDEDDTDDDDMDKRKKRLRGRKFGKFPIKLTSSNKKYETSEE